MPASRTLVDAFRQHAHLRDAFGNLLPEQHATATWLRALPYDNLNGIRLAQIVRVHSIARRQDLIDQRLGMLPLLGGHTAIPCGRRSADR